MAHRKPSQGIRRPADTRMSNMKNPELHAASAEDEGLVEPTTATRSSPFAIASLVVAGLAAYGAPRFFLPIPLRLANVSEIAPSLVGAAAEIALSILALWL